MVKITFVVGAGKLARQKYDANLQKQLCSSLRNIGFQEDKGASCLLACAGSYKSQHDTGKNIKTVVVFPLVLGPSGNDEEKEDDGNGGFSMSAQEMVVAAEFDTFPQMMSSKCPAWSQKKRLIKVLQGFMGKIDEIGGKLTTGATLSEQELALYDLSTTDAVQQKIDWLTAEMKQQVESGNITQEEKNTLRTQVEHKLVAIGEEISKCEEEGKEKRLEKLRTQKQNLEARQEMLSGITPITHHLLKREPQIREVWKQYEPLLKVLEGAKGRLLTLAENRALGEKDTLEEQIHQLEEESRGWFESDEEFEARCAVAREFRRNSATRSGKKKKR